jgi:hypothetical protein
MREALERLERAIGRLDAAVTRAPSEGGALKEELEDLRRDHAALSTSAAHVADRLDAVIGQVRTMLED